MIQFLKKEILSRTLATSDRMYERIERNEHQSKQLCYIQDSEVEQPVAKKPKQPKFAPPAYLVDPNKALTKVIAKPKVKRKKIKNKK